MSDALPILPRPNLEQYKRLAKDLQRACRSSESSAIRDWAARWAESLGGLLGPELRPKLQWGIQARWNKFQKKQPRAARCLLADAQFFIARMHGFESWPKFRKHVEAMAGANSPVSQFETAVDAIVSGDADGLARLLLSNPELARARSTREHRSTLLHYVSANGVEDFRQRTPPNIVEIAKLLLNAGADVNAESEAYGGRSTALGLTATSCHPENAGVQIPLMELLLDRGALIDRPDGGSAVNDCLRNGRGQAAEFLAARGARLDLEGAAGVGRLDIVESYFSEDARSLPPDPPQPVKDSFAWACQFGRTGVVEFLLKRGIDLDSKLRHNGQTGLHWAAYGGHAATVKMLLDCGSPVETKDETYNGTPLEWALYAWGNAAPPRKAPYYEVVALLARAGAKLDPAWFVEDSDRKRAADNIRSDPRMLEALATQPEPRA
jgi:ankyrin repeat protein